MVSIQKPWRDDAADVLSPEFHKQQNLCRLAATQFKDEVSKIKIWQSLIEQVLKYGGLH